MLVFVLFEKNTENEVCVRERHFSWWARDREVARKPESGCRVSYSPAVSDGTCEAACACRVMRARHSSANSEVVSCTILGTPGSRMLLRMLLGWLLGARREANAGVRPTRSARRRPRLPPKGRVFRAVRGWPPVVAPAVAPAPAPAPAPARAPSRESAASAGSAPWPSQVLCS